MYDSVDLRVKPESTISTFQFFDLGVAYTDQEGYLYYAETVGFGDSAQWLKQTLGPGGIPELDEGRIRWAKLALFKLPSSELTVPYVLYSRKTQAIGGNDIVLWRPGGF